MVQKLSTIDVKSDHSDKTLPSYFSPSKSTSSFSSLTTPTLTTSLAKDDPRVNIGDCEKDVTSEPITVSLHDSPPCEEDGISFSDSHQSLPQFPAPYTSRFIEGPMSSPSFDRSHQSLHRTSMSDTFDNNEEGGTRVRISVSGPSLASRPSTPPSNRYHHEIPPSPPSPMSRMDTIRHDVRRGEDMV